MILLLFQIELNGSAQHFAIVQLVFVLPLLPHPHQAVTAQSPHATCFHVRQATAAYYTTAVLYVFLAVLIRVQALLELLLQVPLLLASYVYHHNMLQAVQVLAHNSAVTQQQTLLVHLIAVAPVLVVAVTIVVVLLHFMSGLLKSAVEPNGLM